MYRTAQEQEDAAIENVYMYVRLVFRVSFGIVGVLLGYAVGALVYGFRTGFDVTGGYKDE